MLSYTCHLHQHLTFWGTARHHLLDAQKITDSTYIGDTQVDLGMQIIPCFLAGSLVLGVGGHPNPSAAHYCSVSTTQRRISILLHLWLVESLNSFSCVVDTLQDWHIAKFNANLHNPTPKNVQIITKSMYISSNAIK